MSILAESRLSITQLAKRENVNASTIWRWVQKGVRGCRLETVLVGGKRQTSVEAFARFVDATTAAADGRPVPPRTSRQRQRDIDRAEAALAKAGI